MRLYVLDGMRFVAAFSVLMFHFTARDHSRWSEGLPTTVFPVLSEVSRYGYVGVHLFFVISGFVILMSAWGRTIPEFVGSRIGRLYPAFWAAVLLTASLRAFWPSFSPRSASDVAVNLTMLNEPFDVPAVDGVYWTLWVELQFYILISLLVWRGISEKRILGFGTALPIVFTSAFLMDPSLGSRFTFLGWAPLFAAGMMLFLLYRFGFSLPRLSGLLANVLMSFILAFYHQTGSVNAIVSDGGVNPTVFSTLVVLVIALVGISTLPGRVQRVNWRFLGTLGALTYPVYLIHEYFGWATIQVVNEIMGRWITLGAALTLSLFLAMLLVRFVDRPLGRILRRVVTNLLEQFSTIISPGSKGKTETTEPSRVSTD